MAEGADSVDPRLAASGDVDWDGEMSSLLTSVGRSVGRGDTSLPPKAATFTRDAGQVPMRSRPRSRFVRFPAYGLMRVADRVKLAQVIEIAGLPAEDELPVAPKVSAPPAPSLSWDDGLPAVPADEDDQSVGALEQALADRRAGLTSSLDSDVDVEPFEVEAAPVEPEPAAAVVEPEPAFLEVDSADDDWLDALDDIAVPTRAAPAPAAEPVVDVPRPSAVAHDREQSSDDLAEVIEATLEVEAEAARNGSHNPHWVPPTQRKFTAGQWRDPHTEGGSAAAEPPTAEPPAEQAPAASTPAPVQPQSQPAQSPESRFAAMDALREIDQIDLGSGPAAAPSPSSVAPSPNPSAAAPEELDATPKPGQVSTPAASAKATSDPAPATDAAPPARNADDMVDRTSLLRELSTLADLDDL